MDIWTATATTVKWPSIGGRSAASSGTGFPTEGFENLPVDEELSTSALGKTIMGVRSAPSAIGRAFGVTPGTPADRVKMLQDAFAQAMKDPELLAEAAKAKIPFEYLSPETIAKYIAELVEQPPEIQKEMVKYIRFGS